MDESYAIRRYEQAAALLPLRWQQQARQLPPRQMARAEELRLRAGGPMTVLLPEGEITPGQGGQSPTVTQTDLEQLCDAVTDYSRYAAGETLSRGYLTARGGFRVGVCGTAVLREGVNTNLRDISSVTVRIGREQPGLGDEVLSQLFRDGQFRSTVLLSPPGLGKTTLLRDLIRGLSDGVGGLPEHRVSVVDERGEIRSLRRPMPRLLERQARRTLCGGCFARVLSGLESGQPLPDAWADAFRQLEPPEAAGILRDTELTGDEERIVSALTAAVHRLEELADRRRRDSRQRERLLWAAALSGAGLFIILLI